MCQCGANNSDSPSCLGTAIPHSEPSQSPASSIAIVTSADSAGSRCDAAEAPNRMIHPHLVEPVVNPVREKGKHNLSPDKILIRDEPIRSSLRQRTLSHPRFQEGR